MSHLCFPFLSCSYYLSPLNLLNLPHCLTYVFHSSLVLITYLPLTFSISHIVSLMFSIPHLCFPPLYCSYYLSPLILLNLPHCLTYVFHSSLVLITYLPLTFSISHIVSLMFSIPHLCFPPLYCSYYLSPLNLLNLPHCLTYVFHPHLCFPFLSCSYYLSPLNLLNLPHCLTYVFHSSLVLITYLPLTFSISHIVSLMFSIPLLFLLLISP